VAPAGGLVPDNLRLAGRRNTEDDPTAAVVARRRDRIFAALEFIAISGRAVSTKVRAANRLLLIKVGTERTVPAVFLTSRVPIRRKSL